MVDFKITEIPSPNFDVRPAGTVIDLIVIHAISLPPGEFGGQRVIELFTNSLNFDEHPYFSKLAGLRVSSHYFIDRSGRVVRFVDDADRAWHAGVSRFAGRENCNDYSIGIELEGSDSTPFSEIQYVCLKRLLKDLKRRYPAITDQRIVGHCHVAPRRKTDPGPLFEWHRIGVNFAKK